MALTWKKSAFGTSYLYIGKISLGSVDWCSPRKGAPAEETGYQFRSQMLREIPEFKEALQALHPSEEDARKAAETIALAFAEYIIRKVHGDAAFETFMKGR